MQHTFAEDGKSYSYSIRLNSPIAKYHPMKPYAITLGSTIHVAGPRCWPDLHAHEFRHVVQWAGYGWLFAFYYLRGVLAAGYAASWAETEARDYARAHFSEFADVT